MTVAMSVLSVFLFVPLPLFHFLVKENVMIRKIILTFFILLLIVLAVALKSGFYVQSSPSQESITFTVSRGMSLMAIAQELEAQDVVPNAKAFYYYVRLFEKDLSIQAGDYKITTQSDIISTVEALQTPLIEGVLVTIPEGFNQWEIANRLAATYDKIDSADVITLCYDTAFIRSLGITDAIMLEGYLFPETYSFPKNTTAKAALTRMVQEFDTVYNSLVIGKRAQKYSKHQLVSLASIVEEETQVDREFTRVAGVFYNRLEQGITIGADATVRYAIKKFTGPLKVSELKNPSPYNTRLHKGIPPGPIGSPGRGALGAVANPLTCNDIFFVAKWDGSGEHDFSVTYAEHNRKKLKYRKANKSKANW